MVLLPPLRKNGTDLEGKEKQRHDKEYVLIFSREKYVTVRNSENQPTYVMKPKLWFNVFFLR